MPAIGPSLGRGLAGSCCLLRQITNRETHNILATRAGLTPGGRWTAGGSRMARSRSAFHSRPARIRKPIAAITTTCRVGPQGP
jgi:hypothetical protein